MLVDFRNPSLKKLEIGNTALGFSALSGFFGTWIRA